MAENRIRKVHFIGIGGVGMSGIARVAKEQGMEVSGSDLRESRYTQQLREAGVKIFIGQSASNLDSLDPDVVVVSTAILDNNPELKEAHRRNLPIWHRAKMLAQLGHGRRTLAVAGTHGKTTTSSMLASVIDGMGFDPTFLIGGIVRSYGSNAHSGTGDYYVVEADESDKSFTYLDPESVLVTNIEADHLDHYQDLNEIYELFGDFMSSVHDNGCCVVCGEDKPLVKTALKTGHKVVTYGFSEDCDTVVSDYKISGVSTSFKVTLPDGQTLICHLKQNPGKHNALNAAGVLTLLSMQGFDMERAAKALSTFSGVRRRFDLVGQACGVTILDDYAHHPTEIAATIEAAKSLDFKRVCVVFQPHRYSRIRLFTEVLRDEFASAFDKADLVVFTNVYSAGETPVPGVTGATFMEPVREHLGDTDKLIYIDRRMKLVPYLVDKLEDGDLIITMGAGDVTGVGPELLAALKDKETSSI